ncbi:unnamed protein product [Cuscuta campestris]|uniref:Uncharacterized protein n=1 Tax=Cuscuta campestris TaxID=132261 RepID=A0A484KAZ0_9ASTE|nr:unnamed protein product [Cuscuta campestris]
MESHGSGFRRVLVLAFCVAGIWSAYIYQGVLQETVSTKQFGPDKKRFEHLAFLNLAQNVVCLIWSFLMIQIWSNGGSGGAPWWSYWSAGITNTIGPAMGIEALKYISYPAQVLAKSSKMIPVMLMGTLVYGIRYTIPEYVCTLLVAGGVSTFALSKTSSKTISKLAHPNAPLGYGLCFLNLAFDGFTNATQDSIALRYPKTSAWDIMLGMNLWGTIYNMVFMFGWSLRSPMLRQVKTSVVAEEQRLAEPALRETVVERRDGLLGFVVPNLLEVDETTEVAKET